MLLGEVSLSGHGLDPDDPHLDVAVANFLEDEVKKLIHQAQEKRRASLRCQGRRKRPRETRGKCIPIREARSVVSLFEGGQCY